MKKTFIFLGSSVTYGACSGGTSFVDFIGKRNHIDVVKEAVSGTTLVDEDNTSYISRMLLINETKADLFVCQLSTNDATKKKPLGQISDSFDIADFDTDTVTGAIEYIISYAKSTWKCPIMFYTNPKYQSKEYEDMVIRLKELKNKWAFDIIDLWENESFNGLSKEQRELYMADPIHPTKAGYSELWTPYFEQRISEYIGPIKDSLSQK